MRSRSKLGPADRRERPEETGRFRAIPVREDPIAALRASGKGGATARLLADRQADREGQ
ncbi:AbrB family transcriptional regulator [Candidatus Thiodictyon syntrophicum]|jgi:hypothetical protein|uniref:AbrB family transcriptional regulator n=1 Tax=Candidatus Thiodictyon syntrophicum TaxID=1166950 RepID=UPI000C2D2474|nr:AbrB family transcriptional regulator [Candidatus Thiodictyon syntrophicum]